MAGALGSGTLIRMRTVPMSASRYISRPAESEEELIRLPTSQVREVMMPPKGAVTRLNRVSSVRRATSDSAARVASSAACKAAFMASTSATRAS